MAIYKILKDCYLLVQYTWHCGDGCCWETDSNCEFFSKDSELELYNAHYQNLIEERSYTPSDNHSDCRIPQWHLDERVQEGCLELVR